MLQLHTTITDPVNPYSKPALLEVLQVTEGYFDLYIIDPDGRRHLVNIDLFAGQLKTSVWKDDTENLSTVTVLWRAKEHSR